MIPREAHFLSLGSQFPTAAGLAVLAAVRRGEFARVVLHAESPLETTPGGALLEGVEGIALRRLDAEGLLEATGPKGGRRIDRYRRTGSERWKRQQLWPALLFQHGGVFLELDVIVLASFAPLYGPEVFVASERGVHANPSASAGLGFLRPRRWAGAALQAAEPLLARLPPALSPTRALPSRPCPAVVAAEPAHWFLVYVMESTLALAAEPSGDPEAMASEVLRAEIASHREGDLRVLSPEQVCPLGPLGASRWLRRAPSCQPASAWAPEAVACRWYAARQDPAQVARIDRAYLRRHRDHQLFSHLVAPLLPDP